MWQAFSSNKRLKIGLIAFLVALVTASLASLYMFREKTILGHVVDCQTNEPVDAAEVSVNRRGWGFDGGVVWDKSYVSKTISDQAGFFTLTYRVGGTANILAKRDGYITAQHFEYPKDNVVIAMLKGDSPTEVTYNCVLSSDCLVETVDDGVRVYKNICA